MMNQQQMFIVHRSSFIVLACVLTRIAWVEADRASARSSR
jgi:hypothetical protein